MVSSTPGFPSAACEDSEVKYIPTDAAFLGMRVIFGYRGIFLNVMNLYRNEAVELIAIGFEVIILCDTGGSHHQVLGQLKELYQDQSVTYSITDGALKVVVSNFLSLTGVTQFEFGVYTAIFWKQG